ncbi:PLP-dependent aminotransferase family protein [Salinicoccus bachuensis]|uniref:PLP-dependent aminotransferase family protein n=1 Tax=Salinicoccus bachuensis TaxID=3136731 RepID=A0ABZ3CJW3_9STAP
MLKLKIDHERNAGFIYRQVYEGIKEMIMQGRLTQGYRLPSKRVLAKDLGVSTNSVANAYEQLIAEGYLYSIEKSGYYVEAINPFKIHEQAVDQLPEELKEDETLEEDWLSFTHITTNVALFPFKKWIAAENHAIRNYRHYISGLNHFQGPYIVRESIRDLIAVTRGVSCFPEQLVLSTGTLPLINQILDMAEEGARIAIEDPGYSRMYTLLKNKNFTVIPIPLDDKGINMEVLEKEDPDYVFVTPSHQFPTGTIMPISRRIDLLNWAAGKPNRFILEDDYDSEFKYTTDNIPSLQSLDKNQKVIYCGTFSKTLLPSFRFSYAVLPIPVINRYKSLYREWIQGNNTLQLLALKHFIDKGDYSKHVRKMNLHHFSNRQLLISKLYEYFGEDVKINDIPAGLHFLAEFRTDKSYEEIMKRAVAEKIEIYDMRRFSFNSLDYGSDCKKLILGFANLDPDLIEESVARLYRAVAK